MKRCRPDASTGTRNSARRAEFVKDKPSASPSFRQITVPIIAGRVIVPQSKHGKPAHADPTNGALSHRQDIPVRRPLHRSVLGAFL